jgi:hypothetical protein
MLAQNGNTSVGTSPAQAITTYGSDSWSLLAHCQMPIIEALRTLQARQR